MTDQEKQALQRRTLANLMSYREDGYRTYLSYAKRSTKKYAQVALLYGVSGSACFALDYPLVGMLIFGAMCGLLFRDYQWVSVQNVFWPILQELIDWKKVEVLHQELSKTASERTSARCYGD